MEEDSPQVSQTVLASRPSQSDDSKYNLVLQKNKSEYVKIDSMYIKSERGHMNSTQISELDLGDISNISLPSITDGDAADSEDKHNKSNIFTSESSSTEPSKYVYLSDYFSYNFESEEEREINIIQSTNIHQDIQKCTGDCISKDLDKSDPISITYYSDFFNYLNQSGDPHVYSSVSENSGIPDHTLSTSLIDSIAGNLSKLSKTDSLTDECISQFFPIVRQPSNASIPKPLSLDKAQYSHDRLTYKINRKNKHSVDIRNSEGIEKKILSIADHENLSFDINDVSRNFGNQLTAPLEDTEREECLKSTTSNIDIIEVEQEKNRWNKSQDDGFCSLSQLSLEDKVTIKVEPFYNITPRPMPESPHQIIEEEFLSNPWCMLVATIFLTKTSAKTARWFMKTFFEDFPTPYAVIAKDPAVLECYFETLGLRKRGHMIWKMSHQFVSAKWRRASDLCGIGKYGEDAYRLFCLGHTDVEPTDRYLRLYLDWLLKRTEFLEESGLEDCEQDIIVDPVAKYYSFTLR